MAGTVQVDGDLWRSLQPPEAPEITGPAWVVTQRSVSLVPREEEVQFEARWRVLPGEARWVEQRLAGAGVHLTSATLNGAELAVEERDSGPWMVVAIDGPSEIVVRGVATGDARQGPVMLDLMAAAAGSVQVDWDRPADVLAYGAVVPDGDRYWTAAAGLSIGVGTAVSQGDRGTLVVADVGLGLTVGEGAWTASARLRWQIRQGEVSEVAFRIDDPAPDLVVTGPSVAEWRRSGDRVVVTLLRAEDRLVRIQATWTGAVPDGDEAKLAIPTVHPEAFRVNATLQLARDGDLEVIPALQGWQSVAHQSLPEWGKDLTLGAPTASYTASKVVAGSVTLTRFTPVSAPPTFVDVATITAAATADGRVLMRAHYAVRNDRAAHLRITPPAGASVVGARVAGETASVAIDDGTWLIPLEKSVETVEGLLSFPVEITLLLDDAPWDRREQREISIPRVNAPVAVMRATMHLPPGFESSLDDGDGDVVDVFTEGEGITYGSGSGQSAAAEVAMQNAVSAWMDNDFDAAQGYLEDLEELDAFDSNAQRLQSNLYVISGEQSGQFDVAMERRVKEQAKARAFKDVAKQEEALKTAEEASLAGDYAAAEVAYGRALDLGGKLDKLEQGESVEVSTQNVVLEKKMKEVKDSKKSVSKSLSGKVALRDEPMLEFEEEPMFMEEADEIVVVHERAIDTSSPSSGTTLSRDALSRIPGGRSYQSAVSVAAGVTGQGGSDSGMGSTGTGIGGGGSVLPDLPGSTEMITYNADGSERGLELRAIEEEVNLLKERVFRSEVATTLSGRHQITVSEAVDIGQGEGGSNSHLGGGGGVTGGVIGGVKGGVLGGMPAEQPAPVTRTAAPGSASAYDYEFGDDLVEGEWATPDSSTLTIDSPDGPYTIDAVASDSRVRSGDLGKSKGKPSPARPESDKRGGAKAGRRDNAPAAPPPPLDDARKPAVRAVALSVVIPNQGQTVRFEHMLLPQNATYSLDIDAKTKRRDP